MMELLNKICEYDYYIFKSKVPNLICIFEKAYMLDGWLTFSNSKGSSSVCELSFRKDDISMQVRNIKPGVDCIHIDDGNSKYKIYGYGLVEAGWEIGFLN